MEFEQLICVYKQVHGAGVAGGADILCIRYMERRVLFSVCNRIIDGDHFRHEYSSTCRAGYFRPIECRRPKVSLTVSGAKMPSLSVQSKFKVTSLLTAV